MGAKVLPSQNADDSLAGFWAGLCRVRFRLGSGIILRALSAQHRLLAYDNVLRLIHLTAHYLFGFLFRTSLIFLFGTNH